MHWLYTLTRRADGEEWSGRFPGNQSAVWDLGARAKVRARLANGEEPEGEFVLRRQHGKIGSRYALIAEVNVVTIN